MHKRSCFQEPFGSQPQKLLKSAEKHFYPTFSSFLVRSKILGLLVNTLTADYKYSRSNRENLPLPNQVQLSKKRKTLCCNFIAVLKSTLNFIHFEKNEAHSFSISEIIDSERRGYLNA